MNKFFTLIALFAIAFSAKAQQVTPVYEPYGKVSNEDLAMKACDFDKDANAEILIRKGDQYYDQNLNIIMDYHERIKIFNDEGKDKANIRIEYYSIDNYEYITGIQAETINMVDGKQEITKLDKKLIYKQTVDKYRSVITFTMPNVKAGSIIEYKYTFNTASAENIPTWYFQDNVPIRYGEYMTNIPEWFFFSTQTHMHSMYTKRTSTNGTGNITIDHSPISYTSAIEDRVLVNEPALRDEPYMSSRNDNLECVLFNLTSFRPPYGFVQNFSETWAKVGEKLSANEDFGGQFKRKLTNEDAIIEKAKALKTDDEKIAYLFKEVQNDMKWNEEDDWYTNDGTCKAWDSKTGNSTEINLILYHLLKKSGVKALPMVVSTRKHGKVNPVFSYVYQFNRAVVYIPVDSTKSYILDASSKYNMYNEIPYNLLNSSGLYVNSDLKDYELVFLNKQAPVRTSIFITADIKPDGKVNGTAQLSSYSYGRIDGIKRYKTDGEKKYIDYLRDDDNNLKIASLKMDNMDVDTLPLMQSINFNLDLAGSDENYIYFNPNLFTSLHKNPFLSDTRTTDIDFGYLDNLTLNGMYKVPAGYKIDALPKNVSMTTPDNGITFRRFIAEQDGTIAVRYTISYKKSIYFKENYADFHEFFKKMYEMLNEQIVLKKS
ncbi:protein of unknown function [Mucilaginibacter mallensis]|uniref:DUF3857 domain-containing protein n=1 Tax=Mucilaginibacter mallensis TaxID=652787 RepID=A0A1H1N197_MUCMA|nr:DUF3857 domain-containing protein [Mucilaginibacter mallensis]SDR92638.1 protein of unknown function [Mucilaginibacter mallensis]